MRTRSGSFICCQNGNSSADRPVPVPVAIPIPRSSAEVVGCFWHLQLMLSINKTNALILNICPNGHRLHSTRPGSDSDSVYFLFASCQPTSGSWQLPVGSGSYQVGSLRLTTDDEDIFPFLPLHSRVLFFYFEMSSANENNLCEYIRVSFFKLFCAC